MSKNSDNYRTDKWLIDLFRSYYDPCPFKSDRDLLNENWAEHTKIGVYVNPPYSNPKPWIIKAIQTKKTDQNLNVVMLLKHDSSTEWFRLLHEHGAQFLMINGRLKFNTGKSAPFPSVLVIL